MPAGLSLQQMLRVPYIIGTLKRYHSPGTTFSSYYGLGMMPSRGVQSIEGRSGQYDIFDGTRSLAPFAAPGSAPVALNRKQIGSVPITVPRIFTSIGIEDEQIYGIRNLGQGYSQPVGSRGEQYFVSQVGYMKTRATTSIEYMCAHMFRGGWKLKPYAAGSQMLVLADATDATAGAVFNDTKIPASHVGAVTEIGTSWDDPSANLIDQLMALQVRAARENGRRLTDIWVNGNTGKHLFTNNVIQAVGGSVYTIFDTLNPNREITEGQKFPDTGVTVVFRGLPDYKFHIYNQGYVAPGTSESFSAQIDAANWQPFIPDNKAIITPPPGDWCGMVEGTEPMQWNLREANSKIIQGFGMGTERAINPPRTDVKLLYNGAPVITEPYAVYFPTVIF